MNIELNETIESEFLKLEKELNLFPNQSDYVNKYKAFKTKFDSDIHPEIKTKILEIEKSGYYNDHGVDHIRMVIERVSRILSNLNFTMRKNEEDLNQFYISPYEIFILLMAINLHDTGHLIASRSEHARKGKELLAKFDKGNDLSSAEKRHIGDIAKAHGGKDDPIGKLTDEVSISHQLIRPQLLASLLRLGDELAEDKTRASNFLLNIGAIEKTSEIYHRYSASLDSLEVFGGEIKLSFYIEDDCLVKQFPIQTKKGLIDRYLIDEIYERTLKTFTEGIYCSRFLPEKCRVNLIRVNIYILSQDDHEEIKSIKYEIKESGYPLTGKDNIFEMCSSLTENGEKLNGEYIKNLIQN